MWFIELIFTMAQRIEPFFSEKKTLRIELFVKKKMTHFKKSTLYGTFSYDSKNWTFLFGYDSQSWTFFLKYDSKNWIWLKGLIFFQSDLKNCTSLKNMTHRIKHFFWYDSKNWIFFKKYDSKNWTLLKKYDSKNSINSKTSAFFSENNWPSIIEPFEEYDTKNWTFLKNDSHNWTFFIQFT